MKMDRMNEIFVNRGFSVSRGYLSNTKEYEFVISKDGISACGLYKFSNIDDMALAECQQRDFIEKLILEWSKQAREIEKYCINDIASTQNIYRTLVTTKYGSGYRVRTNHDVNHVPGIENVMFNAPATIVFWMDGTKTVVRCQDGDVYDPEKGLAIAIAKKAMGNQGNYCNVFKKWLPEQENKK